MVAQHQVHYQWNCIDPKTWKHDEDRVTSTSIEISKSVGNYQYAFYTVGNLRSLAIYINDAFSKLKHKVKELAIDATYGTNK